MRRSNDLLGCRSQRLLTIARRGGLGLAWALLPCGLGLRAQVAPQPRLPAATDARINAADEPAAETFSLGGALRHAQAASARWRQRHSCVTCHTNGLSLLVDAALAPSSKAHLAGEVFARGYLRRYVVAKDKPRGRRGAIEGLVATTAFLAMSESRRGPLHATTQRAFDHVLRAQDAAGHWPGWLKCKWPPFEVDDHFGVTLVTLALAQAPQLYRATSLARRAMRRLRAWLRGHAPTSLHQKGMLLWAGRFTPGLVAKREAKAWVTALRAAQKEDGGWVLAELGDASWPEVQGAPRTASDAYATGFVVFVLRQAGLPAGHRAIVRGLRWLEGDQRASGRWHVRSPRKDSKHYISQAATNFALLAFASCGRR